MNRWHWVLCASLSCVALAAPAGDAHAEETPAQQLFREGRALMVAERFAEACPKLEESRRLDPKVTTLLNLAACHERVGKIATAWAGYRDALAAARAEGNRERVQLAEERIEVLEPELPKLTVLAPSSRAPVELTMDGEKVPQAEWGKARPVDPGEHLLVASGPTGPAWQLRVVLRATEQQTVSLPSLGSSANAPAAPPPAVSQVDWTVPTKPEQTRRSPFLITSGALLAAGGLAALAGGIVLFTKSSVDDRDFVEVECQDPPDIEGWTCHEWQDIDTSDDRAAAGLLLAGGALGVIGGTFMIVYGAQKVPVRDTGRATPSTLRIQPLVGPGSVALRGRF